MTYFFLFRWAIVIVSLLVFSNAGAQVMFSKSQDTKVLPLWNPNTVPVYRSKADSIRLSTVEASLSDALSKRPSNQARIDSLFQIRQKLSAEGIIRFRKIYRPSNDFINADSLRRTTDFKGIVRVNVSNKKLIPAEVFKCLDLEVLELTNTALKKLPSELNKLTLLKTVRIYNNNPRGKFRFTRNEYVTWLTIRNENPKLLPASYRKLEALQKLDLAENLITRFPNGARRNKKLDELILQRNELTLRKGKIRPHPYVQKLALQNNKIQQVPSSLRRFRNLKKLSFNGNAITRVHESIQQLKQLEQLFFYNNRLTAVPAGVYKLPALMEIDLFHNQIERLEPEFVNWKKLHTLYLSHNRLLELPENLHELTALVRLYLWDNRLTKLPESLGSITTIKYLRVNNNYLRGIPQSVLRLTQLEEIDISHNFIEEIPEEFFNYSNLKIFAIGNNPWNAKTREFLKRKVGELRARQVFVHVSDDGE